MGEAKRRKEEIEKITEFSQTLLKLLPERFEERETQCFPLTFKTFDRCSQEDRKKYKVRVCVSWLECDDGRGYHTWIEFFSSTQGYVLDCVLALIKDQSEVYSEIAERDGTPPRIMPSHLVVEGLVKTAHWIPGEHYPETDLGLTNWHSWDFVEKPKD